MSDSHEYHRPVSEKPHSFSVSRALTYAAIGVGVAGAAIILAPHVLPAIGIGSEHIFDDAMWVTHGYMASATLPISQAGSGIAGIINRAMASYIPLIGEKLAAGGWFNALSSGAVGIGGVVLGNFINKQEDGSKTIRWGKLIKYAAITASALIALPTLLSGLTMGITYLSMLSGNNDLIDSTVGLVNHTLGVSGGKMHSALLGFSGAAAAIPHLLTCGIGVLPAAYSALRHKQQADQRRERAGDYSDGSIAIDTVQSAPLEAGKPCELRLRLRHEPSGRKVSAEEIALTHTQKLHVFIVDDSLRDYQHIHPQPSGEPGEFVGSFTPKTGNGYVAWADFTLMSNNKTHRIKNRLASATRRSRSNPSIRVNTKAEAGGLSFEWQAGEPLRQNEPTVVTLNVRDAQGRPVTDLEPVMGAYAHLVGFGADGNSIVHTHPLGPEPHNANDRGGPKLRFHVEADKPGAIQFYAQVKRGGEEIFVPFGQQVQPAASQAQRMVVNAPLAHQHGL